MNRTFKIFAFLAVLTMALASVSPAFAQDGAPPKPGDGPLSEYIVSAFAASSGLSVDEIQTRMANGETIGQIANSLALDKSVVADAVNTAITEGLNAGAITQEQVDKIARRLENRRQAGTPGSKGGGMLEKLGLTQEELQAKLDSGMTMEQILTEAGLPAPRLDSHAMLKRLGLTKDELQAKLDSGMTMEQILAEAGVTMRPGNGEPGKGPGEPKPIDDAMLEKLGLTKEEFQTKLDSGMTMKQIFEEAGVPMRSGNGNQGDGNPPKPGDGNPPPPPGTDGENPPPLP